MEISRTYKNGKYGEWLLSGGTLAEKLEQQKIIKTVMSNLTDARLRYYETTPHGKDYKDLYNRYFKIHKRGSYEIHELIIDNVAVKQ